MRHDKPTYTVFRRSATGWDEFATARKYTIKEGITLDEARELCESWNSNRTPAQVRAGTKYEFTRE